MKALRLVLLFVAFRPEPAFGDWPEVPVRLVELEVTSCSIADAKGLRRISKAMRKHPEAYAAGLLREEPGVILDGRWIRSRPTVSVGGVHRSAGAWTEERAEVRAVLLRSTAPVCHPYAPGTRHLLALHGFARGTISHCDTVPPGNLDCVLEPDTIAFQPRASALRLAPPEPLRALRALPGAVLFDCAPDGSMDAPAAVRPLLGRRNRMTPIRRVEVGAAPQTGFERRDDVMIRLEIDSQARPRCHGPALLCSRGICFEESSRQPSGERRDELLFFVHRPDARELVSALEALPRAGREP